MEPACVELRDEPANIVQAQVSERSRLRASEKRFDVAAVTRYGVNAQPTLVSKVLEKTGYERALRCDRARLVRFAARVLTGHHSSRFS
jgi:hypothetical protein